MSTRSLIGVINSDTIFTAVYCHYDGYPTGVLANLRDIIGRDGAAKALATITAHGWESLTEHPTPESDPDLIVPGYGVRIADGPRPESLTDGHPTNLDRYAWVYLFSADLSIVSVYEGGDTIPVAVLPVSALAAAELDKIECGVDFERCSHYAYFHDPAVPAESRCLGMRQWLGEDHLTLDNANAVTDQSGSRWTLTGSGRLRGNTWYAVARQGEETTEMAVYTLYGNTRTRLPGLTFHYPPVRAALAAV